MDNTTNLALPYIAPAQAQKHVTHNEAIRHLDTLVMLSITSRVDTSPPTTPADGERYIVADNPQGSWSDNMGDVATWVDNAWQYMTPKTGWMCWSEEDESILVFKNGEWREYGNLPDNIEQVSTIGINTQASQTNRLSISANATLLTNEGNDHRLVINKQAIGDTASVVFQTNYSGRAEFGLNGSDNFSLKVSANGSDFTEALSIDKDTGSIKFPNTNVLQNFSINLYQDSGRFSLSDQDSLTIGSFNFPKYLNAYNGTTTVGHGKFIYNNSSYGGSLGALNSDVNELISKIKETPYRRYGVEFWVTKLVQGTGQGTSLFTHDGITCRLSLFTGGVKAPNLTFHAYLKAKNAPILIKKLSGIQIYIDGIKQSGSISLTPTDGWKSITITDSVTPRETVSYQPYTLNLYAEAATEYLLACPALMGGITKVDPDIGVIASSNSWPAT